MLCVNKSRFRLILILYKKCNELSLVKSIHCHICHISNDLISSNVENLHLSIVAGLVVRHGDLSHEMTLSHEGRRPECDNVNRV